MPASYRNALNNIYTQQHQELEEIGKEQKKLLNDRYKEDHEEDNLRTLEMHAGLWLDKYIEKQEREDVGVRAQLVREVATLAEPAIYKPFYEQWYKLVKDQGAEVREAHVTGRMIVGLGSESVLETSIALHRTYGMPYIPGSSLKGLVSSYVRNYLGDEWQESKKDKEDKEGQESNNHRAFKILFGDTKEAGYITFFDALYIPGTGGGVQKKALYPDIITVHHQQYYQRGGKVTAPADWDSPIPVPFLSATGHYLIALAAPDLKPIWLEKTFEILGYALRDIGIGAKTSSGYGRMTLHKEAEKKVERPVDPAITKLVEDIKSLPDKAFSSGSINKQLTLWLQNSKNPHATLIARTIVDRVGSSGNAGKVDHMPLYQRLKASLQ